MTRTPPAGSLSLIKPMVRFAALNDSLHGQQ